MVQSADIAIVGAGIAGLSHAYCALKKGYKVVLFDREEFPIGASVRNFGMIWPIGQEQGEDFDLAFRSREIWNELAAEAGFWINNNGSLHLAYHDDEWSILNEFCDSASSLHVECELISSERVTSLSPFVRKTGLRGAMYSKTESIVYPRDAVRKILLYLENRLGLVVRRRHVVTKIQLPVISTGSEKWTVERAIVCTGPDLETLYPDLFKEQGIKKCKLQMMKLVMNTPADIGPSLCAGLTLRHYKAFASCKSLALLDKRYDNSNSNYKQHGIHVLISQNHNKELIVGDSHHYGDTLEPFDLEEVNELIIDYMKSFLDITEFKIIERWNGTYPKAEGKNNVLLRPEAGVYVVNGLGGAGMTLSFGIAERTINSFS